MKSVCFEVFIICVLLPNIVINIREKLTSSKKTEKKIIVTKSRNEKLDALDGT